MGVVNYFLADITASVESCTFKRSGYKWKNQQ